MCFNRWISWLTVRPSFDELRAQSSFASAVNNSDLSADFYIVPSSDIERELNVWTGGLNEGDEGLDPMGNPTYEVSDDYVELIDSAMLSYKVPPNTTLVEVLSHVNTTGICFANLTPRPSWWFNGTFPSSDGQSHGTNETMHLLPVDPTVEYTIGVGPVHWHSRCRINGIRSYPFY